VRAAIWSLTTDCQVPTFVIRVTYAPSAAASDARSDDEGDVGIPSRRSDAADEAAPPAPEGLAAIKHRVREVCRNAISDKVPASPAYVVVIANGSTKPRPAGAAP
jgi:hypothetical protein